jgi:aminoglycoside phosphotransferase (APT) family kinase protein
MAFTPDFSLDALEAFARAHIAGLEGPMVLAPTSGGQSNPTFYLSFGDRRLVLRKQPPGELAPSAHAVDREFRILQALHATAVPVPRPLAYCGDRELIGTLFYIMECVDGTICYEAALPDLLPEQRRSIFLSAAGALRELHALDPAAVGLADLGKADGFYQRQVARWGRFWHEHGLGDNPALDAVLDWLERNLPVHNQIAISHGDFRFANLMIAPNRQGISAIFDWELSTIGHPHFDVGYFCMVYHTTPEENGGLLGLDLAALGIPTKHEFLSAYFGGRPDAFTLFDQVFALFRGSAGAESVAARAALGQGTAENSFAFGRQMGASYAQRALQLISDGEA